ncbi:TrmH family RNA methyltransferase [Niallia sp. Krafla_26]|uniref:TrmH family RNA methyltransferase n=1 Tax=Niallia sp. Krafla_26 TaxID=3064703 RepID=UPI003D16AB95
MKHITSVKNGQVKEWKKLHTKKGRDQSGLFLIEGYHLVEEALKENFIQQLILHENTDIPHTWNYDGIPVTVVTNEVMKALSDTETPQGIMAICQIPKVDLTAIAGKKFLLIDSVQDPGNIGTMIRTADAAGMDAVILGDGCADPYNPKVVRSTQGSLFHLPIIKANLEEFMNEMNIPVYGTALEGGIPYNQVEPMHEFALLVGNEGQGVSKNLLAKTTKNLYIPIFGKSESLNVAIAAGILMYYLRK